jgi:hypothetical protein
MSGSSSSHDFLTTQAGFSSLGWLGTRNELCLGLIALGKHLGKLGLSQVVK